MVNRPLFAGETNNKDYGRITMNSNKTDSILMGVMIVGYALMLIFMYMSSDAAVGIGLLGALAATVCAVILIVRTAKRKKKSNRQDETDLKKW